VRRWVLVIVSVVLVVAGAVLVVSPLWRPLPRPTAEVVAAAEAVIPGSAPQLPWPTTGQAVLDVEGAGRLGQYGEPTPIPIASVAKVMTAYLVLTDRPLDVGAAGPAVPVTAEEIANHQAEAARSESLISITAGQTFTERQALLALLLPSANNMARILAAWDAGSVAAFVAKMNTTAATLGMGQTHYTDPAGFDPGTVSTAADQVSLAHKAMAIPAFAELVAQPTADLPGNGTVTNANHLLGQNGVVGIKTGSTTEAGGCLLFAAKIQVQGQSVLIIGAVFGQPGTNSHRQLLVTYPIVKALLVAAGQVLDIFTVVRKGQLIAKIRGPIGTGTALAASDDLRIMGWPGMAIHLTTDIPVLPKTLKAGTQHGRVTVSTGGEDPATVSLQAAGQLQPPDRWTRILHHE
jgi:D-alanyl-D-alanine carboxypeptidase (penicillin-binding protein 5/6)